MWQFHETQLKRAMSRCTKKGYPWGCRNSEISSFFPFLSPACVLSCFSHVRLLVILWACQAPLSMGFSRQEYWSELPWPSPTDLPDPRSNPGFLCLLHYHAWFLQPALPGKPFLSLSPPILRRPNSHAHQRRDNDDSFQQAGVSCWVEAQSESRARRVEKGTKSELWPKKGGVRFKNTCLECIWK